jgi:ATP-dependent DNA helicase RecQ
VGKESSDIKTYQHEKLDCFGIGSEKDIKYWNALIRQLLLARLLDKEIENYGLLKVTQAGKDFLQHPQSFMMTEDHDYEDTDAEMNEGQATDSLDPVLISMLLDLRKKIAKRHNIPPFVVFQETSIEDMAVQYPITIAEMANIIGVGQGKAQKFGKEFIELIAQYVEDNSIERPQDMIVKSVVNKSGNKVQVIQSIDRKVALRTIAESRGISLVEMLDELEKIVLSGTKVNIDYQIKEELESEEIEEIFEFFRSEEYEKFTDALNELVHEYDYSEENVRMVWVKFLSEMGN